ncbi:SGNH/GDSL hydrolase family protein [Flavobacterium fluviatile]|uniref:SGNH/GDSL hydrolase family protein n=1 Tax=Flavobacterium fluviatile TaxID=1862387 RepID=UPI001FCB6E42|nr:SGNH/GDSL hydrolase family protein [Flavobacterium fluviatile]
MKIYKKFLMIAMGFVFQISTTVAQHITYAKPDWGTYSATEDGFVLANVMHWPEDGKLVIDRAIKPRQATLLAEPSKKLKTVLIDGKLTIFLPEKARSAEVTVVKIQLIPNDDWANLNKYKLANSDLKKNEMKENSVVFMGNSITERWVDFDPDFFTQNNYIGRGISGQTTSQMLLRFKQDVIQLHPKAVVIHAGTNDIAGNTGPITVAEIAENIFSMAELAKAHNIKVIVASVLPASSYSWSPSIEPVAKITELNNLLQSYAQKNELVYLDYYSALVNEDKGLKKEYGRDTVHPNLEGYKVMEPLAKAAINKALGEK